MIAIRDRVRFEETDLMAVVYHSRYLTWLEMGRVAYLETCGVDLVKLMDAGVLFPIRDVHVRYVRSARFGDEYEVQTTLKEFNRAKIQFAYKVVNTATGKVLVEGETMNVFTDRNGKIKRLGEPWFSLIQKQYEQEQAGRG
ncbi:MAG: acyl-CoA thioesterase [Succiniclasticum sp.]